MFGNKKKHHKAEPEKEKKKWQIEFEEEANEPPIDTIEINPKELKIDSDEVLFKEDINVQEVNDAKPAENENINKEDHEKKDYEWMDSDDELSKTNDQNLQKRGIQRKKKKQKKLKKQ